MTFKFIAQNESTVNVNFNRQYINLGSSLLIYTIQKVLVKDKQIGSNCESSISSIFYSEIRPLVEKLFTHKLELPLREGRVGNSGSKQPTQGMMQM